jgi:hypothetical protein
MGGLCDEHIARRGRRNRFGAPGHIAYDYDYVASRRPLVVLFLSGRGFQAVPEAPVDTTSARWREYDAVSFRFNDSTNPLGQYVNLLILRPDRERIASLLRRPNRIDIVPSLKPAVDVSVMPQ